MQSTAIPWRIRIHRTTQVRIVHPTASYGADLDKYPGALTMYLDD